MELALIKAQVIWVRAINLERLFLGIIEDHGKVEPHQELKSLKFKGLLELSTFSKICLFYFD